MKNIFRPVDKLLGLDDCQTIRLGYKLKKYLYRCIIIVVFEGFLDITSQHF